MKAAVITFLETREKCHQHHFQQVRSEGVATDHTFKYAKVICAGGRKGKAFTASYTNMSLLGSLDFAILTMTKSCAELDEFMEKYAESRKLSNDPPLKVHFSDNLNADGSLWKKHFKNELEKDVVRYQKYASNLPLLSIDTENGIEYLSTPLQIVRVATAYL